jgi:chromosome segregation ATPase
MPELSPSAVFLDSVSESVRDTLAALDRHEASLAELSGGRNDEQSHAHMLGRLEENLAGWQSMLGDMAERVRTTQDELANLDADLKRSLDAFAAARKHLQGN